MKIKLILIAALALAGCKKPVEISAQPNVDEPSKIYGCQSLNGDPAPCLATNNIVSGNSVFVSEEDVKHPRGTGQQSIYSQVGSQEDLQEEWGYGTSRVNHNMVKPTSDVDCYLALGDGRAIPCGPGVREGSAQPISTMDVQELKAENDMLWKLIRIVPKPEEMK